MNDMTKRLAKQTAWQISRAKSLSWEEKIHQSRILREAKLKMKFPDNNSIHGESKTSVIKK